MLTIIMPVLAALYFVWGGEVNPGTHACIFIKENNTNLKALKEIITPLHSDICP